MARHRQPARRRQMRQERLDLGPTHLRRMAQAVEPDEGARPVHIGLFGTQAVMQAPRALAHAIEQPRGAQRRQSQALRRTGNAARAIR